MKTKRYKGSCLCGAIKVTINRLLDEGVIFCHCSQCRKNFGMYGAFIGVPDESFEVSGEENIRWYKSSAKVRRGFCKKCGSPIAWKEKGSENTYTHAGLFENLHIRKGAHIFTGDKGGYYRLCDSLPKSK